MSKDTATIGNIYKKSLWQRFKKQKSLQLFVLSGMIFLLIFKYIPMFGIIIAFKDYSITTGISGMFTSTWVGLENFKEFINDYRFANVVSNTLAISLLKVIFSFPLPILFALMLNEVSNKATKRIVQTVSYLPHFISWVIIAGIATAFFSGTRGVVNDIIIQLGLRDEPLRILTNEKYFWGLATGTAVWKETGWWSIIFLASIAGVDPSLYESAEIDGASRLQRIWHITLPAIKGSVMVVLILTIGSLLGGGLVGSNFEQSMLLGNSMNNGKSEIVQTYAFKTGLVDGRFDYATSVELMQSAISVILIFSSNYLSKKFTGSGLF